MRSATFAIRFALPALLAAGWWVSPARTSADAREAGGASRASREQQTATFTSKVIGLRMTHPARWTVTEKAAEDAADVAVGDERLGVVRFTGVGDADTALALLRHEKPLAGGDADARVHVEAAMKRHREATTANGGKVLAERDCTVAGADGRLIELEVPVGEVPLRILSLYFVRDGRLHNLTFCGQRNTFEGTKPTVVRMIESMRAATEKDAEKGDVAGGSRREGK